MRNQDPLNKALDVLESRFDNPYWTRGKDYLREGLVREIVRDGSIIKAKCRGNSTYSLKIDIDKVWMDCTCPCGFPCKHLAALIMWLRKNKPLAYDSLDSELKTFTKPELIRRVKMLLKKNPSNHDYFHRIGSEELPQEVKELWPKSQDWASFYAHIQAVFERVIISNDAEMLLALVRRLVDINDHFPESSHLSQEMMKITVEGKESINLTRKQDREITRVSKQITS